MSLVRRRSLAWLLVLPAALAVPSTPVFAQGGYPRPVADFGEFEHFPASVGPYRRAEVVAYAPQLRDFSIAYNAAGPELQSAVTLYFYPRRLDAFAQMRAEQAEVVQAHPGARVVAQRQVALARGTATLVTFEFAGDFGGLRQPLSSQLLVVLRDKDIFKVRSTAPAAQREAAEQAMLALVQAVDWDSVPDR